MYDVLVVDDYKIFVTQLMKLEFWEKYKDVFNLKYAVYDSVEALNILEKNHVDILITDINMPKLNGLDLIKKVKDGNLCDCCIVLSEYNSFEYAQIGIDLGVFAYMTKPVSNTKINSTLLNAIKSISEKELSPKNKLLNSQINVISECILECNLGLENSVQALVKYCNDEKQNLTYNNIMICDCLSRIHTKISYKHRWIKNILNDIQTTKNEILKCENIDLSSEILVNYCQQMKELVQVYYPKTMTAVISNVVDYVLKNIYENKISLEQVSEACFVNKTHLSHTFKKVMGVSFVDYVVSYKMNCIKKMLDESDLKLFEISAILGYDDYKYVSKLFKNYFGLTPSEYKKSII